VAPALALGATTIWLYSPLGEFFANAVDLEPMALVMALSGNVAPSCTHRVLSNFTSLLINCPNLKRRSNSEGSDGLRVEVRRAWLACVCALEGRLSAVRLSRVLPVVLSLRMRLPCQTTRRTTGALALAGRSTVGDARALWPIRQSARRRHLVWALVPG